MQSQNLLKKCQGSGKISGINFSSRISKFLFPLTGLLALIWFLVRVIQKPSRASYPCMQIAAPIALTFVGFITTFALSVFGLRQTWQKLRARKFLTASLFIGLALIGFAANSLFIYQNIHAESNGVFVPIDPPNTPMGEARGIFPGRVAWVHDTTATNWDGESNYWWSSNNTNQEAVTRMLTKAITTLTGKDDIAKSWDVLFKRLNRAKGKGDAGYQEKEKIAIKINLNNGSGKYGNKLDATPQMVYALLDQLVNLTGVSQRDITLYDAQRVNIAAVAGYCAPTFAEVRYNDWGGWVADKITFSSSEVEGSDVRRLPKAVVEADYLINMALLKRHSNLVENWSNGAGQTGVTLTGKNNFGTIGSPSALHETIRDWKRGMGTYNPIVDIMGSKYIGGNTVLFIVDGLYGGDYHFATPKKWQIAPFNNDWPSSVFASLDELAIDSVCLDFLNAEWGLVANADNYLHEAALVENPPSGTKYQPDGKPLKNLGVHEHWNNPEDKQYSRNLKTGDGIELVHIELGQ